MDMIASVTPAPTWQKCAGRIDETKVQVSRHALADPELPPPVRFALRCLPWRGHAKVSKWTLRFKDSRQSAGGKYGIEVERGDLPLPV